MTDKVTPKGTREKITPERAKELAQVTAEDIPLMLEAIKKTNPALWSLLIAVPDTAPKKKKKIARTKRR